MTRKKPVVIFQKIVKRSFLHFFPCYDDDIFSLYSFRIEFSEDLPHPSGESMPYHGISFSVTDTDAKTVFFRPVVRYVHTKITERPFPAFLIYCSVFRVFFKRREVLHFTEKESPPKAGLQSSSDCKFRSTLSSSGCQDFSSACAAHSGSETMNLSSLPCLGL